MRTMVAYLFSALSVATAAGCGGDDSGAAGAAGSSGTSGGSAGSSDAGGGTAGTAAGGTSGGISGTGGASGTAGETGCETVSCEALDCGPRPKYVPLGQCCPRCGPDCSLVDCRPLNCGPSVVPYQPPNTCCPICGPDCANVTCADVSCPPGTSLIPPEAGQCCGTCVGPDGPICDPAGYRAFRDRLIAERNALACEGTVSCSAFAIVNRCEADCGTATNQAQAAPLARSLLAFSETQCRGCRMPEPCPPRLFEPQCVNGACTLVRP